MTLQDLKTIDIDTLDDMYLADNDKVFKIAYNPEITSFKRNVGDSITQTLGSQYPFFRRNGLMNYLSFQIGGLISYQAGDSPTIAETLEDEVKKEREFRKKILDFLYSFSPKLFVSAQEGRLIVKLTNVSLTPNKSLGRRIYSFTATATEVDSIEHLNNYFPSKTTT